MEVAKGQQDSAEYCHFWLRFRASLSFSDGAKFGWGFWYRSIEAFGLVAVLRLRISLIGILAATLVYCAEECKGVYEI